MWFLTIDPFIGISVFIAKLSKRQYCWRLLEDFHSQDVSNSLTYTVASSCVCTSPLAVMTIVELHDFVKVPFQEEFNSFLLITCVDAPESTTNSRSSGLRFDGAGRHQFSEGEKNVALSCSCNFKTLLASFHAASRAPCSCHSVPPETDPQILEHWGYADEVHLGKSFRAKDFGLECQRDVQRLS